MVEAAKVTPARAVLNKKREKFPVRGDGKDRVVQLYEALRPGLPAELNAMYDRDELAVGEVGIVHPSASTAYPDTGYTVSVTTGMMVYIDLVMRALSGSFVEGATGAPVMDLDGIKELIAVAGKTYIRQTQPFWKLFNPQFSIPNVAVSAAAEQHRETIEGGMKLFMLAHELGHVAIAAKVRAATSENEEVSADEIGLDLYLNTAAGIYGWRGAVAGAGMMIRLFVTLERLGLKLTSDYPPQDVRLGLLRAALTRQLKSQQIADELATVMVALFDLTDHLEEKILGHRPQFDYTIESARIGLIARLIEVSTTDITVSGFVAMYEPYAAALNDDQLRSVLSDLCSYYWQWAQTRGMYFRDLESMSMFSHQRLMSMSFALRAILSELDDRSKSLLDSAYRA